MHSNTRIATFILVGMLFLIGCSTNESTQKTEPDINACSELSIVVDDVTSVHDHIHDGTNNSLLEQNLSSFQLQAIDFDLSWEKLSPTTNSANTLEAMYVCDTQCKLLIIDLTDQEAAYMVTADSILPGRPFSKIDWISPSRLEFDQWTQPQHGIHYEIDVCLESLTRASPFRE